MKFRFCGDLDCADWVLAEIITVSKISSIKVKQLCSLIIQSLINGTPFDEEKLNRLAQDTKLEIDDIRASVSLILFVLKNSVKYKVTGETLSFELQQLGLPKEHASSICKNYEENQEKLEQIQRDSSLKLNALSDCSWNVEYVMGTDKLNEFNDVMVNLKLKIDNTEKHEQETKILTMTPEKLKLLIHELKEARKHMINP